MRLFLEAVLNIVVGVFVVATMLGAVAGFIWVVVKLQLGAVVEVVGLGACWLMLISIVLGILWAFGHAARDGWRTRNEP